MKEIADTPWKLFVFAAILDDIFPHADHLLTRKTSNMVIFYTV